MTDFNDPAVKKDLIAKILNEHEISYRKMQRNYKEFFDFLDFPSHNVNVNDKHELHKHMYDFLCEPTIADKKCSNPACSNERTFTEFRDKPTRTLKGYNLTCGRGCSDIVVKRGVSDDKNAHLRKNGGRKKKVV